jgi:flagellar assembly protein FliH
MSKNVFRSFEVKSLNAKVYLKPPQIRKREAVEDLEELEDLEEIEEVSEYDGPTVNDLRQEAERFKAEWEGEKAAMIASAQAEAEKKVSEAEQLVFGEIKIKNDAAVRIKSEALIEAERLVKDAEKNASTLVADATTKAKEIENTAYDEGFEMGKKEGFTKGEHESARLVGRLHLILSRAIDARGNIIDETETQLVQLVLQIAKKVIKVLSENQKNIVVNNAIQALRKLKSKADVIIRVNLEDLKLTTENTKNIIEMIENVNNITVMEDTTVDKGGCIIETDFGQIDARIASQLREIEEKIIELVPIKTKKS